MKYAVIKSGGKQYKVSEGQIIEVDKLPQGKEDKFSFENVLLMVSDGAVKVGKPNLSEKVEAKVIEHLKGDKIRVSKFKSKVRYRRTSGFRSSLTRVEILSLSGKETKKKS